MTFPRLTEREQDALMVIHRWRTKYGCSPSVREINESLGLTHQNAGAELIDSLTLKGWLTYSVNSKGVVPRSINFNRKLQFSPDRSIPIIGEVS